MLDRRTLLIAITAASTFAFTPTAMAVDHVSYSQQAFEDAQAAGKPILVEISASWCPTCKAQKKIMNGLLTAPELAGLTIFEVDFDSQKDVVRAFNAQMQSTLITFKGTKEVGRSVGDTNTDSIKKLLDTTT